MDLVPWRKGPALVKKFTSTRTQMSNACEKNNLLNCRKTIDLLEKCVII